MTRKQARTIAIALFHDGIDVDNLSAEAKRELREAVDLLLASSSLSSKHEAP